MSCFRFVMYHDSYRYLENAFSMQLIVVFVDDDH